MIEEEMWNIQEEKAHIGEEVAEGYKEVEGINHGEETKNIYKDGKT